VFVAFVLAVLLGVDLGLVAAELYTLRQMTMPLIIFACIPHPVLAPMFIIWFLVAGDLTLLSFTGPSAYVFPGVEAADAQLTIGIDGVSTFGA
jgi:NitT/TauT family transport system permease protein